MRLLHRVFGISSLALAVLLAPVLLACAASRASNQSSLPSRNVAQCRSLCDSAGAHLESIVVVANQTGCVCGFGGGRASNGATGASAGGAVAVMLAERQRQPQRQQ